MIVDAKGNPVGEDATIRVQVQTPKGNCLIVGPRAAVGTIVGALKFYDEKNGEEADDE